MVVFVRGPKKRDSGNLALVTHFLFVCRASGRTESFVVEGVSVEHDLVPLITSDIGVYGENYY